jgi:hypothetical protein
MQFDDAGNILFSKQNSEFLQPNPINYFVDQRRCSDGIEIRMAGKGRLQ